MEKSKFDIELPQEIIDALARHIISEIRRQRVLEERQAEKDVEDNIYESKSKPTCYRLEPDDHSEFCNDIFEDG